MNELEFFKSILAETNLSDDEKRFLIAQNWTSDEVPKIESIIQYNEYGRRADEINSRLREAGIKPGMPEFSRSPDEMLATALGARMIEWEQRSENEAEA